MIFGYADPPYPGHTRRGLYKSDPRCAEVDHVALISELVESFPDGWALSTSSPALRTILPMCPTDTRVMAWVKPFAIYKPGVNPGYCWEPVLVRGGRRLGRDIDTVRDFVSANVLIRKGCAGAKPEAFCRWLFQVLGAEHGDQFVDLYPGSGMVSETWVQVFGTTEPAPVAAGERGGS